MPHPNVWIVNDSGNLDVSPATTFGVVRPIFSGTIHLHEQAPVVEEMRRVLDPHATRDDFVLYSGYSYLNSVVAHYFWKRFGVLKALIWVPKEKKYRALTTFDFEVPSP